MSIYQNMIGYKIFKESDLKEDEINLLRITNYVKKPKSKSYVDVIDTKGVRSKIFIDELKEYRPLTPDGYLTISVVSVTDQNNKMVKDIIVTASKILEIRIGITFPYAICRQSVNDIFADMYISDSSKATVGLAINKDECPNGFDMGMLLACDKILEGISLNFYRNDTLDDILELIDTASFDYVLENLYNSYISSNNKAEYAFQDYCNGWCRNLKTLLQSNNFQSDIDQMLGITSVDFKIEDFIIDKELPDPSKGKYTTITDEFKLWLSGTFKVIMNDVYILEYYHDIDLAEFNNSTYLFLRDNTKKLYFIVYTINNERLLADLEDEYNMKHFNPILKIKFFNKYGNK